MSTLYYRDDRLAMDIDDVRRSDRVTKARILNEASSWGMARRTASHVVDDVLGRVPPAVERALTETPGVPEEIRQVIDSQLGRFLQPA